MSLTAIPYNSVKGRKDSVAIIDIGSSKITCFIAEPNEDGLLSIIGIGHHHSKGLKCGMITDIGQAEKSVACAVELAEKMANVTIDNAMVNISFIDSKSDIIHIDLNISGNAVTERDIIEILTEGCNHFQDDEREIIHSFVNQYQLDGAKGIRDPRNMYGMLLQTDMHIISVDKKKLYNLANLISRCHLDISEIISTPYATGLGCLENDEKELGVAVIDMGAEETSIAIFNNSAMIYQAIVPIGGNHVTRDLAQCLSTSLQHAERIKTLHGRVSTTAIDSQHMIHIPPLNDENSFDDNNTPRSHIIQIIRPRIEETFELIFDNIKKNNMQSVIGNHIVLTGGASQMVGVRELASNIFNRQVRIAKPKIFAGLAESVSSNGFSCAVGMLNYAQKRPFEEVIKFNYYKKQKIKTIVKVKQFIEWLKNKI